MIRRKKHSKEEFEAGFRWGMIAEQERIINILKDTHYHAAIILIKEGGMAEDGEWDEEWNEQERIELLKDFSWRG